MSKAWGTHYGYIWLKKDPLRKLLTMEEQGCYFAMFSQAIAAKHEGRIEVSPGRPYDRAKVAKHLEVPLKVFNSTLDKCIAYGRIALNSDVPSYVDWTATVRKVRPPLTPEQEKHNRRARLNSDVPVECDYAEELIEQTRDVNTGNSEGALEVGHKYDTTAGLFDRANKAVGVSPDDLVD